MHSAFSFYGTAFISHTEQFSLQLKCMKGKKIQINSYIFLEQKRAQSFNNLPFLAFCGQMNLLILLIFCSVVRALWMNRNYKIDATNFTAEQNVISGMISNLVGFHTTNLLITFICLQC